MVQFFNNPGVVPQPSQGAQSPFFSTVNNLVSQGLGAAMQNMFEEKQYQKQAARQSAIRKQQMKGIAPILKQFGATDEDIQSIEESGLDPKDALALAKLQQQQQYVRGVNQLYNKGQGPRRNAPQETFESRRNLFAPEGSIAGPESEFQAPQRPKVQYEEQEEELPLLRPEDAFRYSQLKNQEKKFEFEKEKEQSKKLSERFRPTYLKNQELATESKKLMPSFEVAIVTNEKMKPGAATWDNLIDNSGNPFLKTFKTTNAQILEAQLPAMLANTKDKMGGVLTDAKLELLTKKMAGVGKNKDANRLALYMPYYDNKLNVLASKFQEEILDQNGGNYPANFNSQLQNKMQPYQKEIDRDLTRLLNGKMPKEEVSKLSIAQNVHTKLPNASEYSGKVATNTETGKKYKSDGTKWIEVK